MGVALGSHRLLSRFERRSTLVFGVDRDANGTRPCEADKDSLGNGVGLDVPARDSSSVSDEFGARMEPMSLGLNNVGD